MPKNPVGWFEIPMLDVERATKFYETVLEIKLERRDVMGYEALWFPADYGSHGISGLLMKGDGYHPSATGPVIYFNCDDIDAALARAETFGVTIKLRKKEIGETGWIAWLSDTEGNNIALLTMK